MLNLKALIEALASHKVDFVLIGGMAAVAQGSSHVTADLDICYARDRENIARLVQALSGFQPRLRDVPPELPFFFDERTLLSGLNFTFSTSGGDLDILGEVAGLGGYEEVKSYSEVLDVFGYQLDVLRLDGLILAKRAAGRPKDLRILPELEGLLALREEELLPHDSDETT